MLDIRSSKRLCNDLRLGDCYPATHTVVRPHHAPKRKGGVGANARAWEMSVHHTTPAHSLCLSRSMSYSSSRIRPSSFQRKTGVR